MGTLAPAVAMAAAIMENDVKSLLRQMEELNCRIDAIEKKVQPEQAVREPKSSKPRRVRSKEQAKPKQARKKP